MYKRKNSIKIEKLHTRDFDFRLLFYILALSIIGIFVVHSATINETSTSVVTTTVKQVIGVIIGLAVLFVLAFVDYHQMVKYAWIFYVLAIILLIYVRFFCSAIYGARRWIYVPGFGTIQPSEFSKPALIVFLAFVVFKIKNQISRISGIFIFMAAASPILVLTLIEPDLSTTIVLGIITITALYLAGLDYRWIVAAVILLIPLVAVFLIMVYEKDQTLLKEILEEHQVNRINAFFFPEEYPKYVYQQNNSVIAIGSGGLFGKGLNTSSLESVKNGDFLSEESCDFVFAVIGEEMGFVGSFLVILLLSLAVVECFLIAKKCVDPIGKIIAGTTGASIGFQSIINIAVATLLIPNTGIPLPFLSAGLSSLLSTFIMLGLTFSVGLHGTVRRRVFYS